MSFFGWLTFREGFRLWLSYQENRSLAPTIEETFEGIARNRVTLLRDWAGEQWAYLENAVREIERNATENWSSRLLEWLQKSDFYTELFLVEADLNVRASTYAGHVHVKYADPATGLGKAFAYVLTSGKPLLYGPCLDSRTVDIGPRTSNFHDEVTVFFLQPLVKSGQVQLILAGRIPNDVIGDLIQREAGHVYPDSGDNYLFMAKSNFDPAILPGTALSRSRFEDRTFTLGENLKDGVHTKHWGMVKINQHTEFEIRFTDPATQELHPGVMNTINNGDNLFVKFPGYSDYRHIPVIGKGVTFQLPGSPDIWGMMCEGDLEEAYRHRSVSHNVSLHFGLLMLSGFLMQIALFGFGLVPRWIGIGVDFVYAALATIVFYRKVINPVSQRMTNITQMIRRFAEGGGDLTFRLERDPKIKDETGEIGLWLNNLIDSLHGLIGKIKAAAESASENNVALQHKNESMIQESTMVTQHIQKMLKGMDAQSESIAEATHRVEVIRKTIDDLEKHSITQLGNALEQVGQVHEKIKNIVTQVQHAYQLTNVFAEHSDKTASVLGTINEITSQIHMLGLNAAIEAVRAGESGKGFAVVAHEIRGMAEKTSKQTQEIEATLEEIKADSMRVQQAIEQSQEEVLKGEQFTNAVQEVLTEMAQVSATQSGVTEQMTNIVDRLANINSGNVQLAQNVGNSSEQMVNSIQEAEYNTKQSFLVVSNLRMRVGKFRLSE